MLHLLTREQAADRWLAIKDAINDFDSTINDSALYILLALLVTEHAQFWVIGEDGQVKAWALTYIGTDPVSQEKMLTIWGMKSQGLRGNTWDECSVGMYKYASDMDCKKVIALTDEPRIVANAKRVGGKVRSFVEFPVNG